MDGRPRGIRRPPVTDAWSSAGENATMRALVYQHVACEHPGLFADRLRAAGLPFHVARLDEGEPPPDPRAYDALLVLGGPMNVDEEVRYPWLAAEKAAIQRAVAGGVPFLGICLGAQLLARALGAPVTANAVPEVGFELVELTAAGQADPLFRGWPVRPRVFQWHGDTFALPAGAVRLAGGPACANQAFRYGPRAYGLQFHVEVTAAMIAAWGELASYRQALVELRGPDGPAWLAREAEAALPALHVLAQRLLDSFLALATSACERRARTASGDSAPHRER